MFSQRSPNSRPMSRVKERAGLEAARRRGTRLGRPAALGLEQLEMARTLMGNPRLSARQVAAQLGVHRHCI
jgi:DNA invertase Pin-like site-specific DNA recombinase